MRSKAKGLIMGLAIIALSLVSLKFYLARVSNKSVSQEKTKFENPKEASVSGRKEGINLEREVVKIRGRLGQLGKDLKKIKAPMITKNNLSSQEAMLSELAVIKSYMSSVRKKSEAEGVLEAEMEATLTEKDSWLASEGLKVRAITDKNKLRAEADKLMKFWSKLRVQLESLELLVVWKKADQELTNLDKLKVELNLGQRESLTNKLRVAAGKLKTVKISLDSLITSGEDEVGWQRSLNLLNDGIRYEQYALEEIAQTGVKKKD